MESTNMSSSAEDDSENNCCCCLFLQNSNNSKTNKLDAVEQKAVNDDNHDDTNNQATAVVQETPVTKQPMISQTLHVPDMVSADPQKNQNESASPSESHLANTCDGQLGNNQPTMQENGAVSQNDSKRRTTVKEYMKVENFIHDF